MVKEGKFGSLLSTSQNRKSKSIEEPAVLAIDVDYYFYLEI